MGVWKEGAGWCFCSGGGGSRSDRVKAVIFSAKAAALAAVSGHGTGLLIHHNLLLTTHGNLPSAAAAAAAEGTEVLLGHGRLAARLVPHSDYYRVIRLRSAASKTSQPLPSGAHATAPGGFVGGGGRAVAAGDD